MKGRMARSKRRPQKALRRLPRLVIVLVCVLILALVSLFYVGRYREALRYRQYPLSYKELIVQTAADYSLDPWHVAAVIRCESSFNSKATSSAGARGLMQIMPETGRWLAGKFDEENAFEEDWLYQPEISLKYGGWFLSWLMQRYDGDLVLATCAYHAGHGRVDGWLDDPAISADGRTIDVANIPYDSTRTYVQRIVTACAEYNALYDFSAPEA